MSDLMSSQQVEVPAEGVKKICTACGAEKALDDFHRNRSHRDGRSSVCGKCQNARARQWRRENAERFRETERQRATKNVKKREEAVQRYRERHPEKFSAGQAVRDALKTGRLRKPPTCENCGNQTPAASLQGHHADYSKPLEVEWLCAPCHGLAHRMQRVAALEADQKLTPSERALEEECARWQAKAETAEAAAAQATQQEQERLKEQVQPALDVARSLAERVNQELGDYPAYSSAEDTIQEAETALTTLNEETH